MSNTFDVVVIGAGPAGYVGAIRAAQLGLKVACIEGNAYSATDKKPRLGGTCLNVGCIPSKALLASSEEFEKIQHANIHGINVSNVSVDIATMLKRKNGIVDKMTKGIEFLFKKNKVTLFQGYASFNANNNDNYSIKITKEDGNFEEIFAKHIIIATGSKARHLPNIVVDNITICDNEGALNFAQVPKKLAVIGAGVIGLELGSVWRRLGAEVIILEASPNFLSAADEAIAKEAQKLFTKQGLALNFGVKIESVENQQHQVIIKYCDNAGVNQELIADKLIVSVGRIPNTDNLNLEAVDLSVDERGFIPVNHDCQTKVNNIWAIGDVVRGPMLAHKAEDEAIAVAERIVGQKPHIDYNCIPWVIYTNPEIAWVGKTEKQLKDEAKEYKIGQFPFAANGRALGMAAADGFVKVLACAKTDEILGVHIIGANASDLIAESVVAMEFKAAAEDIARICHPHPSLSEIVREAALATDKRAINM
jgi:dihydrolipoamide dehydrogenase